MGKIRGDPRIMALAHPTRAALVAALDGAEERSTVQLEKETGVTRYHLYHHLQQLVKSGLVENHRDEGRARFWRMVGTVPSLPEAPPPMLHEAPPTTDPTPTEPTTPLEVSPPEAALPPVAEPAPVAVVPQVLEQVPEGMPVEIGELMDAGAKVRWLDLGPHARDAVLTRKMLGEIAESWDIDLDLPFTFVPRGLLVISAPARG